MKSVHRSSSCCCSLEDVFVAFCIFVGLLCISGAGTDLSVHPSQRLEQVVIVDAFILIGGIICLFQAVPCWRRFASPGFIGGYAAVLLGNAAGLTFIDIWNASSSAYIANQSGQVAVHPIGDETPPETPLDDSMDFFSYSVSHWMGSTNKVGVALLILSAGLLSIVALIDQFIISPSSTQPSSFNEYDSSDRYGRHNRPYRHSRQSSSCCQSAFHFFSYLLLGTVAGLAITVCTAAALFIFWPHIETHAWLFGSLVESPPQAGIPQIIMFGAMVLAVLVCWSVLLKRPAHGESSFFRTVTLVSVLLSHIFLVFLGVFDLDMVPEWRIPPLPIIYIMFGTTSSLLLISLLLHTSVTRQKVPPPKLCRRTRDESDDSSSVRRTRRKSTGQNSAGSTMVSLSPYPMPPPIPHEMHYHQPAVFVQQPTMSSPDPGSISCPMPAPAYYYPQMAAYPTGHQIGRPVVVQGHFP